MENVRSGTALQAEFPDWETGEPRRPTPSASPSRHNSAERLLRESLHSRGFVVFHVEYRVQLGDLEKVVNLLGEIQ